MTVTPALAVRRSWSEIFGVYKQVSTSPGFARRLVSISARALSGACQPFIRLQAEAFAERFKFFATFSSFMLRLVWRRRVFFPSGV
jgi:hypothetical protein